MVSLDSPSCAPARASRAEGRAGGRPGAALAATSASRIGRPDGAPRRRGARGSAKLGADYDTDWARYPRRSGARGVIAEGPLRLVVRGLADPEITGLDRLADFRRAADSMTTTTRRR